jgi:multicomponent K+:H+ antiporter subunit G
MSNAAELPIWAALATALLVLLGASLTLIGSIGLLRLKTFYERTHAPTLGTTLGIGCILLGSMLYFSVLQSRPVLHELLIATFMTVTTPITLVLRVRAALYRDRYAGNAQVPPTNPPKASLAGESGEGGK